MELLASFKKNKGIYILICSFMISMSTVFGQGNLVQGVIRDLDGPLVGVTVQVEGSSVQTLTNDKGYYEINVTTGAKILFSYLGYKKEEVNIASLNRGANGNYTVDLVLVVDEGDTLDEIVVVGFGSQKKTNLTGSVAVIDSKQLQNRPVRNASQAMQGLAPGLNISQNNGSLESNPSINIRGPIGVGNSSSEPLILIDGSEGNLTALNPQDIESISILKDAGAAAIYGSRAAYGVILVTTKSGRAGVTTVNYNNNFRINSPTLMPKMMDSYSFAQYFNQADVNGNGAPHFSEEHLQRILDYQKGLIKNSTIVNPNNSSQWGEGFAFGNDNNDWFDVMYRDRAFAHEHNLSLNGGTEKTTYYLSGNFMKQQGLMSFNTDNYDRYAVSSKINSKLSDDLTVGYNVRLVREDYTRPAQLTDGFYDDLGRQGWPTLPLYDPNGFLFSSPSPALGMRDGGNDKSTKDFIFQQLQFTYEPIKGWKTVGTANYRTSTHFRHWDSQRLYNHDVNGEPYLYKTSSNVHEFGWKENYYNLSLHSEYDKYIDNHHFKIMGGFQVERTAYRDLSAQREGIIIPNQPVLDLTSGVDVNGKPVVPTIGGQYQNWATAGFFGRLNYNFKEKYLFEGNLRYDGSSRFRADSRWGWFPSVSAGWNISKEDFFADNISFVNMFKLRASYGQLGNQSTKEWYPTYVILPTGTANGSWLLNNVRPNTAGSPGLVSALLTWESVRTLNAGIDFAMLNNRLTGSFEWFERNTVDIVGEGAELPIILGTSVPNTNNTNIRTRGFETTIGWADHTAGGFGYNVKVLLSDNLSKVTKYYNRSGDLSRVNEGYYINDIWGLKTIGIAKSQQEMDDHLASLPNGGQDRIGSQWGAGDIMYADVNGDGSISTGSNTLDDRGDLVVIGNKTPRYNFGLNIGGNYKNFDFSMFLQGVMKRDVWQGGYYFWGATNNKWWSTGLVDHLDYFRTGDNALGENLNAYYPKPVFGSDKNHKVQTRYLQNASYIRLKNIQLGYTIEAKSIGLDRVRVFIAGENVWTKSKVAGMFDPETVDGRDNGSVYPLSKVWSAGLSATF